MSDEMGRRSFSALQLFVSIVLWIVATPLIDMLKNGEFIPGNIMGLYLPVRGKPVDEAFKFNSGASSVRLMNGLNAVYFINAMPFSRLYARYTADEDNRIHGFSS